MAKRGKVRSVASKAQEGRPERIKRYGYLFLIVCEDQKTEPAYFETFKSQIPPRTIYLKPVGTGRSAKGVVEQALQERSLLETEAGREVDEVWVVFDKDDADQNATTIQNFEAAFAIAAAHQLKVAYSNEAFELWLLLHLADVDATQILPRAAIYERLQAAINLSGKYRTFSYDHKRPDPKTIEIVHKLGNQTAAIQRAERLRLHHGNTTPLLANPSTTVHLLVQALLSWISYFSYALH